MVCRPLPPRHATNLTFKLDLRLDAAKPHDLLFVDVGPGARPLAAAVGVDHTGRFAYLDGGKQVSTAGALSPKSWYQMTLVLRLASTTYDWQVVGPGRSMVFRRLNIRWNPGTWKGAYWAGNEALRRQLGGLRLTSRCAPRYGRVEQASGEGTLSPDALRAVTW